jgi:hypothetical protein
VARDAKLIAVDVDMLFPLGMLRQNHRLASIVTTFSSSRQLFYLLSFFLIIFPSQSSGKKFKRKTI